MLLDGFIGAGKAAQRKTGGDTYDCGHLRRYTSFFLPADRWTDHGLAEYSDVRRKIAARTQSTAQTEGGGGHLRQFFAEMKQDVRRSWGPNITPGFLGQSYFSNSPISCVHHVQGRRLDKPLRSCRFSSTCNFPLAFAYAL